MRGTVLNRETNCRPDGEPGTTGRREALFLVFCCIIAFILRCVTFREFTGSHGEHLFLDPDSYDHLRRITLGVRSFPHVPAFDSYYGFPNGTGQIWSPLFDYLLSAALFVVNGGKEAGEILGFWLSPVLGALTVALAYSLGRRLAGPIAGCTAAAVLAVLPGHILYTFAGLLDHHAAEPLLCLMLMGTVMGGRGRKGAWVLLGFWLAFSILIWRGAVIFWGVAAAALLVQILAERSGNELPSPAARHGVPGFLLGAAFLVPICATDLWGSSSGISFSTVSWFHVILLALAATLYSLLGGLLPLRKGSHRWGAAAAILLLLAPLFPELFRQAYGGISVIGGTDPWLDSINELRSTLFPEGKFSLGYLATFMSGLFFVQPIILVLVYRQWRSHGRANPAHLTFFAWGILFFILPLFRERYMHLAAVTTALGTGYITAAVAPILKEQRRKWLVCVAAGAAALALLAPAVPFLVDPVKEVQLGEDEKYDLRDALAWLKEQTPPTSHFLDPAKPPEYGVLSFWDVGAMITYLAERPTVATNFGWETHGLYESCAFFAMTNPAAAEMLVRQNRVRYILFSDHSKELRNMWDVANHGIRSRKLALAAMPPFDPYQSIYYRLYVGNGSVDTPRREAEGALERYRLLYQSKHWHSNTYLGDVPAYKIFEHVEGAVVSGTAPPGETVDLRLQLHDPQRHPLVYRDRSRADGGGHFRFTVPYPTETGSGEMMPEGAYTVSTRGRVFHVSVTEDQVLAGKMVRVN